MDWLNSVTVATYLAYQH